MTYRPWLRHPRTTAERRANQEGWERPRRRPHLLPNTYDDIFVHYDKCWKKKRKKQYYTGGRGKHHQMCVEEEPVKPWPLRYTDPDKIDLLEDYFKEYNIPYRIDVRRRFRWVERFRWERVGYEDYTICGYTYQRPVHKKIYTGEFYRSWYTDHYIVHWWYDKDIGLDYILKR